MITIRPAAPADLPGIAAVLDAADLRYSAETLDHFTVAETVGRIVGVVRLEEHPQFFFLTSLGVLPAREKQGIATALLQSVLSDKKKPVYLYTIIPGFFRRFGFQETAPLAGLPAKAVYGCDQCLPGQCAVMVKYPDDPPLSRL
ncbi:MAG: GNAT family N-acetyltransferase [Candidatus Margulisiibacteriota bacterium]